MSKKSILITGGSGFIGSHLSQLLKDTYDVSVFDIKTPLNNVKFIQGTIEDKEQILNAVKDQDIIIHLAASVGVKIQKMIQFKL